MGYYSEMNGYVKLTEAQFEKLKSYGFSDKEPHWGNAFVKLAKDGFHLDSGFIANHANGGVELQADQDGCIAGGFTDFAKALFRLSKIEKLPEFDIQRNGEEAGDFEGYTHLGKGKWTQMHARDKAWNGKD